MVMSINSIGFTAQPIPTNPGDKSKTYSTQRVTNGQVETVQLEQPSKSKHLAYYFEQGEARLLANKVEHPDNLIKYHVSEYQKSYESYFMQVKQAHGQYMGTHGSVDSQDASKNRNTLSRLNAENTLLWIEKDIDASSLSEPQKLQLWQAALEAYRSVHENDGQGISKFFRLLTRQ